MKTIIFTLLTVAAFSTLKAQEKPADIKPATAVTSVEPLEPIAPEDTVIINDTIEPSQPSDTTVIRVGNKEIIVIDEDEDDEEDENNDNFRWCCSMNKKDKPGRFNGHWEGLELGFNGFDKEDYSAYGGNEFMTLNQGKSMEVDINFYELNIGLAKSYAGLVSGLGLSFNSYRFDNDYTIARGPQRVDPILLEYEDLAKTKLAVSYLKVPLLLEFQIPVNQKEGRLYLSAGVIGGVKIGSHTKVKHGDIKDKDHSGFYMNDFNYAATARVGYKNMGLFATYSLTPLFKTDKGPELTPFTIGLRF